MSVGDVGLNQLEINKAVATRFVNAFNNRDLAEMHAVFAPDAIWWWGTGEPDATEMRPMQSTELAGKGAMGRAAPTVSRAAFMTNFETIFGRDEAHRFHLEVSTVTAEADIVAVEAKGDLLNPKNGRRYNNYYAWILQLRNGQIQQFREYQDTLHLYDVFYAS